jgi:hypothetical protein
MTFPGFGVGSTCWSFFDYDDKAEEDIVVIDVNGIPKRKSVFRENPKFVTMEWASEQKILKAIYHTGEK